MKTGPFRPSVERERFSWFIYGLTDPRDMRIRYIGRTVRPLHRPFEHWSVHTEALSPWIQEMHAAGVKRFFVTILDRMRGSFEQGAELETSWIERGREFGWPLLNVRTTTGNSGHPGIMRRKWEEHRLQKEQIIAQLNRRVGFDP